MARRRDEAGVAAIVLALAVAFIIVPLGAYGVDLGMQRVARRDMQSLADVVALDLARHLDGTTDASTLLAQFNDGSDSLVSQSVGRNTSSVGDHDDQKVVAEVGTTDPSLYGTDGYFTPITSGIPTAVRVTATTDVAFGLAKALPGGGVGKGSATRSSVATRSQPSVCFSAGSTLLALNTDKSALSPLLEHILDVDLNAVGYSGIVDLQNASVPLAGLMAQLGVGSVEDLATTDVTLGQLALAEARAIKANDPAADVSALQAIHLGVDDLALPLADILNITTGGPTAGLTGDVNAFDLLTSRILLADEGHAVDASVVVPGGAGVTLTIVAPPKIACGSPTDNPKPVAQEAQIDLHVKVGPVNTADLTNTSIDLTVQVGAGDATLTGLSCAPESATFNVDTGAVGIPALPPIDPSLPHLVQLTINVPLLGSLGLDAQVGSQIASATKTDVEVPYAPAPAPLPGTSVSGDQHVLQLSIPANGVQLSAGQNGLLSLIKTLFGGVSGLLSSVLGTVTGLVSGPVDTLLGGLVTPVLSALGVQLGVTDVNMLSRPVCSGVRLIG